MTEDNRQTGNSADEGQLEFFDDGHLKVLEVWYWIHQQTNLSLGGMMGQVTYCKYDGIPFYVRENLTGIPSFYISSAERWGDKVGTGKPRPERQVLELLAHPRYWDKLAEIVYRYDGLKRRVVKNKRFNAAFIRELKAPEKDIFEALKRPDSYGPTRRTNSR
jgi:hypothetical protein